MVPHSIGLNYNADMNWKELSARRPRSKLKDVHEERFTSRVKLIEEAKEHAHYTLDESLSLFNRITRRTIVCCDISITSEFHVFSTEEKESFNSGLGQKFWDDTFMLMNELTALQLGHVTHDRYSPSLIFKFFDLWCRANEKTYASEEEKLHRFNIFKENYSDLIELNNAKIPHEMDLNCFADLTFEESIAARWEMQLRSMEIRSKEVVALNHLRKQNYKFVRRQGKT